MRPVRFNIHPKEAALTDAISMGKAPEGVTGDGFFATQLSSVVGLARKKFFVAFALCYFLLWYRIYGHYVFAL